MLQLDAKLTVNKDLIQSPNLCDRFEQDDLDKIGAHCWEGYSRDKQSRLRWEKRMEAAMDLAMQMQQEKTFPWPGASNVIFPLVTIAALQFSARSYSNIISGTDVVRYRVTGEDPSGVLRKRADRISAHMSWQVLEEDTAWEEQHDRLLINLGIVGTNFVKSYFSPSLAHNVSELVQARDLVIDYWAKSVEAAARKTHIIPLSRNEIYERAMSGTFRKVMDEAWFTGTPTTPEGTQKIDTRAGLTAPQPDDDTPFRSLEQHRYLDLDKDGYAEPYIVTFEEGSKTVLRIAAQFDDEAAVERIGTNKRILRIRPTEYFTKYSFIPSPDGGIYDVGFGTLLGPLNESVDSGINQLIDAGTMANSNGGFLGRGAKIRGGVYTMAPWEWKRVDSTGDDLRKAMVQLPVREPSAVMFQLLSLLIDYSDRIAGTVDQMVGESPGQNTPAETSRNMTEQGMQVYSTIFKRVWRSLKEEFKKLHKLNATFLNSKQKYGDSEAFALQEDYKGNPDLVVPVADPNITSNGMRFMQAQAIREAAHTVPGYDIEVVERNFLRALRVDGIDEFYPGPGKVPPLPNPKMQVEQMKLQVKTMELESKKQQFLQSLSEDRRLNNAKIAQLEAQAIKLMADKDVAASAHKLEAFETIINALKTHNGMIDDRIKTISGLSGDKEGEGKGQQPNQSGGESPIELDKYLEMQGHAAG